MSAHITQEGVPYCHFANLYLVKQVIERDDPGFDHFLSAKTYKNLQKLQSNS